MDGVRLDLNSICSDEGIRDEKLAKVQQWTTRPTGKFHQVSLAVAYKEPPLNES